MFTDHSEMCFPLVCCKPEEELLFAAPGLFSKSGHTPCPSCYFDLYSTTLETAAKPGAPGGRGENERQLSPEE